MEFIKKSPVGRAIAIITAILVVIVSLGGYVGWSKLARAVPSYYESPAEHFKYGSIGVESPSGIPYWIWLVLPRVFADKLPDEGGYASLGLKWEQGKEMPLGFTKEVIGYPRVGINCSTCHISQVRTTPDRAVPDYYLGGPSNTLDFQAYQRFLFDCASDPRFNPDTILAAIEYNYHLSWLDSLLYRYLIIPGTKQALLAQKEMNSWQNSRPDWGLGRVDPFNPAKFNILGIADDGSIGNSDYPSVWNMKAREGLSLHWNGLLNTLPEIGINSGIGAGATVDSIDPESLERVEAFISDLPSPEYPFPVDTTLAAAGEKIFNQECATCHATGGDRLGTVIPLEEVGTDPHRSDAWTQGEIKAWKELVKGKYEFPTMRKEDGYVASYLDGIWLRAPYLHNGSVPSLTALLEAPENRPTLFYSGYDVYNPETVGFMSDGEAAAAEGWRYDVSAIGNSNQGHLYGTDLEANDKTALLEYLKTL